VTVASEPSGTGLNGPATPVITGAALAPAVTVSVTVAGALAAVPSLTVNVKLSAPEKFCAGV
jgi:hypothetical protein